MFFSNHSLAPERLFFSVGLVARTNHVVEREVKNDARETRSIEIENLELARHAAFENDGYRLARRERVGEISMHTKFTFFFSSVVVVVVVGRRRRRRFLFSDLALRSTLPFLLLFLCFSCDVFVAVLALRLAFLQLIFVSCAVSITKARARCQSLKE